MWFQRQALANPKAVVTKWWSMRIERLATTIKAGSSGGDSPRFSVAQCPILCGGHAFCSKLVVCIKYIGTWTSTNRGFVTEVCPGLAGLFLNRKVLLARAPEARGDRAQRRGGQLVGVIFHPRMLQSLPGRAHPPDLEFGS